LRARLQFYTAIENYSAHIAEAVTIPVLLID